MTSASYRTTPAELAAIHAAVCRARKQALCCSTCSDLNERAARAERYAILLAEVA